MGRVIDDSLFAKPRAHTTIYPWDVWLDGQVHELIQDEDFKVVPASFVRAACAAARKRQLRLRYRTVAWNKIAIQARKDQP